MNTNRRNFIKQTGALAGGAILWSGIPELLELRKKVKVSAHLWVYASKYPPKWDSTPVIEQVFSDMSYAGLDGVELMEVNLRHDDAVKNLSQLIKKYHLPVTGTSYGAQMWDKAQSAAILEDIQLIIPRLHKLKGRTLGISVGDAKREKTAAELDTQAALLIKIMSVCADYGIEANLHNHTYEVVNDMHDLKGTLQRVPNIQLGPDLNWLIRGGIDPVWFIKEYKQQISYLHIRDQYANGEWTEVVGEGVTDFGAIAAALKEIDFRGRAAVELAFPGDFEPTRPLKEDWKISRDYVRKVFGW